MKKQLPLDCGPKPCCGKCVPCIGLEKLKKKQQQQAPVTCSAKQRKPQTPPESHRGGKGDANSSSSEIIGYLKKSSRSKKNNSKEDSEYSVCITKKPTKHICQKKESEETIYVSKPKCYTLHESSETVYSRKPKREESYEMICIKKPKRNDSFETVYRRKVNKNLDNESSEMICNGKGALCKGGNVKDDRGVKRESSFVTVYSRTPRGSVSKRDDKGDFNRNKTETTNKRVKREDSEETVSVYRSKRKDCGDPIGEQKIQKMKYIKVTDVYELADNPRIKKMTNVKRDDSDESVSSYRSKRKSCDEPVGKLKVKKMTLEKVKEHISRTSVPEYAEYVDYVPRACVQQKQRPKSREIRAGISYVGCDCAKRNGLQDQCQRTECLGCPKCKQFPPACYLAKFSNAQHLTKLKDAAIKKRCPYVDKKGNIVISV